MAILHVPSERISRFKFYDHHKLYFCMAFSLAYYLVLT